ncbi:MAG: SDR family oxidoreductase [Myxococcota bacterium]
MSTLLLTGATGMVGREVLGRAAADPRYERVLCLVRPGSGSPQDRLDDVLRKVGGTPDPRRVVAIAGDVVEPELGLDAASRRVVRDATAIVHCAASVSFDLPLDEAREINVRGTERIVALARSLPGLTRLDAVSTAYVAGCRTDLAREDDLAHDAGFHNTYEQTKHESEGLLRRAMGDLPIAVHRPSIVVGDSKTGQTGAWKVLYWPLKVIARGFLPAFPYDPEGRLDIVPVDFVADAVLALANAPEAIGRTFHLTAGPARDTTMAELTEIVFRKLGRRQPLRVRPVWWRRVVRPAMMVTPSAALKRTLRSGLVYRPYLELRLRFDTTHADAVLPAAGVNCPRVVDYIDTIVDAALASDFGARAPTP